MTRPNVSQHFHAAAIALAMMLGFAGPSIGAEPPVVIDLGTGEACPDFPLRVELYVDAGHLMNRTFIDKNGNVVRLLQAGQNFPLKFINLSTGALISVKAEGTVLSIRPSPDGSQTWTMTGHTALTWGAVEPGGPATILYVGRLVVKLDSSGAVLSVSDFKGKKTDICAVLS